MRTDDTYIRIVHDTKEYVSRNFHKNLTLSELSRKYFISESYLSKIFTMVTGTTFKKYLYTYRINQAKALLLSGKFKSVREISSKVGFNDVCYFYRVFNRMEGITPNDYILKVKEAMRRIV